MANDIGAMSVLLYGFEAREDVLDIFEEYCRRPADPPRHPDRRRAVHDLDARLVARIRAVLGQVPERLDDVRALLDENRIWKQRTVGRRPPLGGRRRRTTA